MGQRLSLQQQQIYSSPSNSAVLLIENLNSSGLISPSEVLKYEKSIGNSRFLKTFRVAIESQNEETNSRGRSNKIMLLKVFVKPLGDQTEPNAFDNAVQKIEYENNLSRGISNVLNYSTIFQTDRAVYLARQYMFNCLYDRISTRPFLNPSEKKWIVFQLLTGLRNLHSLGICHGDLKLENIMVTSWNWIMITDLSSFKPVFLPEDDPADFSYFFDSSSRGCCYVAPERFLSNSDFKKSGNSGNFSEKLQPEMDIFSVGCIIAELYLEGAVVFNLHRLLQYKRGDLVAESILKKIEDKQILKMILSMIDINPSKRLKAVDYLSQWADICPPYFSNCLHNYFDTLSDPFRTKNLYEDILSVGSLSDWRILKIHRDFSFLFQEVVSADQDLCRIEVLLEVLRSAQDCEKFKTKVSVNSVKIESLTIIVTFLTSCLRDCYFPTTKARCIDLLLAISVFLPDSYKLDLVIPSLLLMSSSDPSSMVKSFAIRSLTILLNSINDISPSDSDIIQEYILPQLNGVLTDESELVKCTYAGEIGNLCEIALSFLEMSQLSNQTFHEYSNNEGNNSSVLSYSYRLSELQSIFQDQLQKLLVDPDKDVKRSVLKNTGGLCLIFGKHKANEILVSHMITYLNDKDWQLRKSFFEALLGLGTFVGVKTLQQYLFPLISQSFYDSELLVLERVIFCLTSFIELGFFKTMKLRNVYKSLGPIIFHPSKKIRIAFCKLTSLMLNIMNTDELFGLVKPMLKDYFVVDISSSKDLSPIEMMSLIKEPVNFDCLFAAYSFINCQDESKSGGLLLERLQTALLKEFSPVSVSRCLQLLGVISNLDRHSKINISSEKSEGNHLYRQKPSPQTIFVNPKGQEPKKSKRNSDVPLSHFFSRDQSSILTGEIDESHSRPKDITGKLTTINISDSGRASPVISTSSAVVRAVPNSLELEGSAKIDYLKEEETGKKTKDLIPSNYYSGVRNFIEKKVQDLFPPELNELGQRVSDSRTARVRKPSNPLSNRTVGNPLRFTGLLISSMQEHTAPINKLAMSSTHKIFASCSDDGTVKIWNCSRLDKSITNHSKLTYTHEGKFKFLCFCENQESVSVCSDSGFVDLLRIEGNLTSNQKNGKFQVARRCKLIDETPLFVDHYETDQNILVIGTVGSVYGWDLRSSTFAWKIKSPPHHGSLSCIGINKDTKSWFLTGTNFGVVSCWDIRFQLAIKSFLIPSFSPVRQISPRIPSKSFSDSNSNSSLFLISSGNNELSSWNVDKSICCEIFCSKPLEEKIGKYVKNWIASEVPNQQDFMWKTKNLSQSTSVDEFLAFAQTSDSIITGGTDLLVRQWNALDAEKSSVIYGPQDEFERHYSSYLVNDVLFQYERLYKIGSNRKERRHEGPFYRAKKEYASYHIDSITSILVNEQTFPMVITASRDGSIKIIK